MASIGLADCGPLAAWPSLRYPAGIVMAVAMLLGTPSLVLLAFTQPLPVYVIVLVLCGVTTGMGYSLGQLGVQSVLPPSRSAEAARS